MGFMVPVLFPRLFGTLVISVEDSEVGLCVRTFECVPRLCVLWCAQVVYTTSAKGHPS